MLIKSGDFLSINIAPVFNAYSAVDHVCILAACLVPEK